MDHGGHGGMDMGPKCSMNMLWNTQIIDTCIVFRQWHISSNFSFFISVIAIVLLGVFYEYLRLAQRTVDRRIVAELLRAGKGKDRDRDIRSDGSVSVSAREDDESLQEEGLLTGRRVIKAGTTVGIPVPITARVLRAVIYGSTVFLSFFLMLVFMTYNAYLIAAVVAGAAIGHYVFGSVIDLSTVGEAKGMACH